MLFYIKSEKLLFFNRTIQNKEPNMKSNRAVIRFETVEDMVKFVTERPHRGTTKYNLRDDMSMKWIDEQAGEQWHKARYDDLEWVGYGQPGYEEYKAAADKLDANMPKQKKVITWRLVESSSSYRADSIELSTELAEMLNKVWKKGPINRWSSYEERKGAVSIPGLLKRLGNTDVGKQIKAAKAAEQVIINKRNRNYTRKQIREAADTLCKKLLDAADVVDSEEIPISFFVNLKRLMELKDEE
jgi:hypothetical protein